MLIAARNLNCFGKLVRAGEPIPDPDKWNPVALASNINLGWVKDVPDDQVKKLDPPHPHLPKKKKPEEAQVLQCECGRSFKTSRALKVHARSHR